MILCNPVSFKRFKEINNNIIAYKRIAFIDTLGFCKSGCILYGNCDEMVVMGYEPSIDNTITVYLQD